MTWDRFSYTSIVVALFLVSCAGPDLDDPRIQEAISEAQNLGLAYLEENRLDEAENEFRKLIELNPTDPAGYANLGIVYLRRGEFEEAENYLLEASERSQNDPSIPLSLAAVYEQTERIEQARQLLEQSLQQNPDHVQTLYKRAQLYSDDTELLSTYISHLREVIQFAPANVVPRFQLVESLAQFGDLGDALVQLMELRQQLPDIPREAQPHFDAAASAMQEGDVGTSFQASRIFHNLMKVTPYYQTSLRLLGLRTDAATGTPVISEPAGFAPSVFADEEASADILDAIQFTDATENAGLDALSEDNGTLTAYALLDFDGNNETDLFVTSWDDQRNQSVFYLFQNQFGRFTDVAQESGIFGADSQSRYVISGDFNNDTFLDLYVINEGPDQLFKNNGDGSFDELAADAGLNASNARTAVFADLDHDGDLDLFVGREGPDLLYRNNMDGSFTEIGETAGLSGSETAVTLDVDFADFDDDGDLDLLLAGNEGIRLYTNLQQGIFEDITTDLPFAPLTGTTAATIGDYNNDGFMDIYCASSSGHHLFLNLGGNRFEADSAFRSLQDTAQDSAPSTIPDARFFDFDNDGHLDLLLTGLQPTLFHNDGTGSFSDVSDQILPASSSSFLQAAITDYNLDRDLDLFVMKTDAMALLRNDGGQQNRMLTVQTRGLVNNNSKNNYYSIGAKVEVRAGDLYQTRVVTNPITYFGLGKRTRADVIRIVFTNGVPQNIFRPGTDQDIIEQQILKGSCPFLYTWNGSSYQFTTDILWRSALGMPLGIMAERHMAYAPADIAEDYVMIPDGALKADSGHYYIKITDELWETPFIDEVKLLMIDHPSSETLLIDEKFGPPPTGILPVYSLRSTRPVTAYDHKGNDITVQLQEADQRFVTPTGTTRYQGLMKKHSITLIPSDIIDPGNTVLYLKGWVFPTDASINVALSQTDKFAPVPPRVQVKDMSGNWVTVIPNMGFPMGKNKVVRVDLSDKFLSNDLSVRIETNMQIYWDHAFFAVEHDSPSLRRTLLFPEKAELHFRGFSRMYRNSPFGPHLFDHDSVSTSPRWLDLEGSYTRYGDVTELLLETDDQYVIMNAGDAIGIVFDEQDAPPLPNGFTRTFILYTNGWLKDGDLNTAHGKTVAPLPFRGMSAYPYSEAEAYPMTAPNKEYMEKYNTRIVTRSIFREWIKP